MDGEAWWAAVHGVARSRTRLSDFTLFFHFHALEKDACVYMGVCVHGCIWVCVCACVCVFGCVRMLLVHAFVCIPTP